jgi:hypothetical protein
MAKISRETLHKLQEARDALTSDLTSGVITHDVWLPAKRAVDAAIDAGLGLNIPKADTRCTS